MHRATLLRRLPSFAPVSWLAGAWGSGACGFKAAATNTWPLEAELRINDSPSYASSNYDGIVQMASQLAAGSNKADDMFERDIEMMLASEEQSLLEP